MATKSLNRRLINELQKLKKLNYRIMKLPLAKTIMFFIISICLLTYSESSFSQEVNPSSQEVISSKNAHYQLMEELVGIYQIQMINIRLTPTIDTDLLNRIKGEQKEDEQVTFVHKENIRINILSKSQVMNGVKFPENQIIIYIND